MNPVFSCCNNLLSSWVERVTTGTYSLVSVILNVTPVGVFTAGLAGLSPFAATAGYFVISVKTQLQVQTMLRLDLLHN